MQLTLSIPQSDFFVGEEKYKLFCGGVGSGKSETLILSVLRDLIQFPGSSVAIYSPTYDLMNLNLVPRLDVYLKNLYPETTWNGSRYIFSIPGLGQIIMRSLDRPERIVAYEVFRSHIDEFDILPIDKAEMAWNKILARNRQRVGGENRISAYTTPEGFKFCHKRWVKENLEGYKLYKAPTYSNPFLPEDYVDNLMLTYPANLVQAYVEGDFVNLTSGRVYKNFSRDKNGSQVTINGNEPLYIGMDFNVMHGASVIHVLRDEIPHAVDEISKAFDTDTQILTIKERYPNNPINCYPDASSKNRTASNTTETDLTKLKLAGFTVHRMYANPAIKERVASLNAKICNGKGEVNYFVNIEKCPSYVNSLEQQVYDANGMPDKSNNLDHSVDAAGYYIYKVWPIIKPKTSVTAVTGGY